MVISPANPHFFIFEISDNQSEGSHRQDNDAAGGGPGVQKVIGKEDP